MNVTTAVNCLAAIAQEARLNIFRTLVQAGDAGLSAGVMSAQLQIPNSTLSFHLKALMHAGLITARQESRFIYYAADYAQMNGLLAYLTEHCCAGVPCCPPVNCQPLACQPISHSEPLSHL